MQSLRAEELADFHLINCNVALNMLDQTAQVRVGERNLYPTTFYLRVSYLVTFRFHFKLTVRIRVKVRLGSELQSGFRGKVSWSKMFLGKGLASKLQSEFRGKVSKGKMFCGKGYRQRCSHTVRFSFTSKVSWGKMFWGKKSYALG